jgi:hypothetical protein
MHKTRAPVIHPSLPFGGAGFPGSLAGWVRFADLALTHIAALREVWVEMAFVVISKVEIV